MQPTKQYKAQNVIYVINEAYFTLKILGIHGIASRKRSILYKIQELKNCVISTRIWVFGFLSFLVRDVGFDLCLLRCIRTEH